ncbi:MAG: energy-coupling factor transporter transmembrane component T [Candidatus Omnitrophica bacterium]|nr:energy-coupling factor transporter transmembrane component T [Candidatus Omnitrophota bacterium]
MKYEHKNTFIHCLSPEIKIAYSIAVSILIVILNSPRELFLLAAAVLLVLFLAGPGFGRIRLLFFAVAAVVLSTFASQAVFYSFEPKTAVFTLVPDDFPVVGRFTGGIYMYREGMIYGLVQSLRLIAALTMAVTVVISTHPAHMVEALVRLRFSRSFSFVITMSIRFLPFMFEQSKRIVLALRMRGIKTRSINGAFRMIRFIFIPLVVNSLRQAKIAAFAAETRGIALDKNSPDGRRKNSFFDFNTFELITISFFIILMYVSIVPFKMGLGRIPFFHTFFFSIPITCVLFIGIGLIPKPGIVFFMVCGHRLFIQIMLTGINPLWWPYALIEATSLELFFLLRGRFLDSYGAAFSAGVLRGSVVYLYFYLVSAPYIWHQFYAPWYIGIQTFWGAAGSAVGGMAGYRFGLLIRKTCARSGL